MPIKFTPVASEDFPKKVLPGVLMDGHHDRLYARIDEYAKQANISKDWFWRATDDYLGEDLLKWAKRFKYHETEGKHGLIIWGGAAGTIDDMFASLCGLLSRNYIRARVNTLMEFIEDVEDGDVSAPSCTLISNFFLAKSKLPDWQLHMILDGLKQRGNHGKQTVCYVDNEKALATAYGDTFHAYLRTKFHSLEF